MTEAQKCLYHIAENMRMDKSISKEGYEYFQQAIKALEQEPIKDEVILTKEEYGELVSSEFDNGYTKGYTEALEQNDVLDKIKAEIDSYCSDNRDRNDGLYIAMRIIDKYKAESKVIERNLCDSCTNKGCIFQYGIVRSHCDFYKAESEDKE